MIPAEISTLQDGHALAVDDTVGSVPISPLTDTADDVHAKEGKQSTQYNDSINESSSESSADEGDGKIGVTKSKPSTSQEVRILKSYPLTKSIRELLEAKTSLMVS